MTHWIFLRNDMNLNEKIFFHSVEIKLQHSDCAFQTGNIAVLQ